MQQTIANRNAQLHFPRFRVGEGGVGNTGELIPPGVKCAAISEVLPLEGSVVTLGMANGYG